MARGLALISNNAKIKFIDKALGEWLDIDPASWVGRHWHALFRERFPDADPALSALLDSANPAAEGTLQYEKDGSIQSLRLEAVRNDAGWVLRCQSILPVESPPMAAAGTEDFASASEPSTQSPRIEPRTYKRGHRWPGTVFTQRPDFSFHYISAQIENLTGILRSDWCHSAHSFWPLVHEADVQELQQHWQRAARTGESATTTFRLRHARTGRISNILEHRQTRHGADGTVLSHEGVWLDITRQTLAEKRLSAAAWKDTLSNLMVGMAHDFNNVLTGLFSLDESWLANSNEHTRLVERLELLRKSATKVSQLIHRITSLSGSKTGERHYHVLNELVSDSAELLERVLPRRIAVVQESAAPKLPVYVDAAELRQVILNLARNAADAMPNGGSLTFRTSHAKTWSDPMNFVGIKPRLPCVCLEIEDTGQGIPARHLPLLFDPFFTTKPANKGSGLGLYHARLCLEKHQGGISVESVENGGARFCLWMPEADFTEAERNQAGETRRSLLLSGEAGPLLDSTAEFLRGRGYAVAKTTALHHASDLLASGEDFAAFFVLADPLDGALPGALREIKHRHAGLKIVLQIATGTVEGLDNRITNCGDLLITHGMSESDILRRLESLLSTHGNG